MQPAHQGSVTRGGFGGENGWGVCGKAEVVDMFWNMLHVRYEERLHQVLVLECVCTADV